MADADLSITVFCARWRIVLATAMCRLGLWSLDRAGEFISRGIKVGR